MADRQACHRHGGAGLSLQLTDAFTLPIPPDEAWTLLNDVPRIAHCFPGATEIETVGPNDWRAKVGVKVGPLALAFDSTIHSEVMAGVERTARLTLVANETKGKGSAIAVVLSTVSAEEEQSLVSVTTDLSFEGQMARHLRGPIVASVGRQLTRRFARCLEEELLTRSEEPKPLFRRLLDRLRGRSA